MSNNTFTKPILNIFFTFIVITTILLFIFYITNQNSIVSFFRFKLLENMDTILNTNSADSFCINYTGNSAKLNEYCNKLTKENCNRTSCCVLLNDDKCVAGNKDGPTYNTDTNGKTRNIDYYYYQNKCYGKNCPQITKDKNI